MAARVLVACASEDTAPERRCSAHAQCDDGFLCGSDGLCRPSTACAGDDQCCPGAVCFSGWCRPTAECSLAGPSCLGLGEVCEARPGLGIAGSLEGPIADPALAGLCVPSACDALGGCAEPFSCIGGRCLLGAPCGGRCGAGQVCEPASERCLPAPAGCDCAAGGWPIASALQTTPLSCGSGSYGCECARFASVPDGRAGVDGRLVATADGARLVSYEPEYGDLVSTRFDAAGNRIEDVAVDGVPAAPIAATGSYRGGVVDPGPDRGARPAVAPGLAGAGYTDVLYRDLDRNKVMFARVAESGQRLAIGELPIDGLEVGRYSCLARRSDGRLAGLVFVSRDPSDTVALLVRVESRIPDPASGDDWALSTVIETPLPPRSEAPCANACGFGEVCVVGPAGETCGGVVDIGGSACGACGAHQVCAEVDGARACRSRVYGRYDADRLPFGEGLYASCAVDASNPGEVYAAWYDADRRRMIAARWPFAPGDRVVVDEGVGKDPGRFASVAVAGGRVAVAWQDLAQATLSYAEVASWGGGFVKVVVPTEAGGEPGVGARVFFVNGTPAIVHLDGRRAAVELLARGPSGCWGRAVVFGAEAHAYPDGIAGGAGAWVSAQALRFDEALQARHAPVGANRALPTCN